jgi:transcriptional regulator with XRE-family HTH domain
MHAQLISQARRDHGTTLEEFAAMCSCSKQYIHQVEIGDTNLSIERIQALASNSAAPEWARRLAFQLWLVIVTTDYAQMGAQLEELRVLLFPDGNGAKRK